MEENFDEIQQQYSRVENNSKKDKKNKLSKQKQGKSGKVMIAVILLVAFLAGIASGYFAIESRYSRSEGELGMSAEEKALENINLLVIGCDWREGENARADVIILATLRVVDKKVSLLSIPRDTYVKVEGHGNTKINHALAYGGEKLVEETAEDLLGVEIHHTVMVNFDGFINIIDAMGGVDIDVESRMYKPTENIDLHPGPQKLNGYDSLAYVRWRDDGRGDIGRIERQQKFIAALTEEIKGITLTEALKVADAVFDSIKTDMSVKDMTNYGTAFLGITADDIKTYSLSGDLGRIDGISYWIADKEALKETMDKVIHGEPDEAAEEDEKENEQGAPSEE